jgi:energy-coupling factor transporter ATP-binding protein EcfA2
VSPLEDAPAVALEDVTVTYPGAGSPTLRSVSLQVDESELVLVVGRTGSGKSTLLGTVAARVPHLTGGTMSGRALVHGRDTRTHRPRDLADLVGVVGQDPLAGFVTDTVEEELAYGMEQLALPTGTMRRRVEETLDLLGIADLRSAPLGQLSGGEQQRVAIGSVLTAHPKVVVLDEPTSALDPTGAEDVLAAITRLVHDLAVTVVLAEHRIERVLQYADRVVHVDPDGTVSDGAPAEVMATSTVAPPVIELGRWAGWTPLPLSVRAARRAAAPLRRSLTGGSLPSDSRYSAGAMRPPNTSNRLEARGVVVRHGQVVAVRDVDLVLAQGEVTALMGRNGAGKSSLLWALQGSGSRTSGRVTVAPRTDAGSLDVDPARLPAAERRKVVGLVPQTASDLLYLDSVAAECRQADVESGAPPGTCRAHLDRVAPGIPADRHPRDLSEGQKLALVLAVQLTANPPVLLLDEPTRGLDYTAKRALRDTVRDLARQGRCVVISTHDVEFVAQGADRVVIMAEGEVVADGPAREVATSSPLFAPQVAKIMAPGPWLTVEDVEDVAASRTVEDAR